MRRNERKCIFLAYNKLTARANKLYYFSKNEEELSKDSRSKKMINQAF
jgi:hypothetical protein